MEFELKRKLAQFKKSAEIAKDIIEYADKQENNLDALRLTSGKGFELIMDSALLELEKKATALQKVFRADYDPEGRVCSICEDNPCCCSI